MGRWENPQRDTAAWRVHLVCAGLMRAAFPPGPGPLALLQPLTAPFALALALALPSTLLPLAPGHYRVVARTLPRPAAWRTEKKVVEDLIASMGREHERPLTGAQSGRKAHASSFVPTRGEKWLHVKVGKAAGFTESLFDASSLHPVPAHKSSVVAHLCLQGQRSSLSSSPLPPSAYFSSSPFFSLYARDLEYYWHPSARAQAQARTRMRVRAHTRTQHTRATASAVASRAHGVRARCLKRGGVGGKQGEDKAGCADGRARLGRRLPLSPPARREPTALFPGGAPAHSGGEAGAASPGACLLRAASLPVCLYVSCHVLSTRPLSPAPGPACDLPT